jgi:hypothetical protein
MVMPLYLSATDIRSVVAVLDETVEKVLYANNGRAVKAASKFEAEVTPESLAQALRHFMNIMADIDTGASFEAQPRSASYRDTANVGKVYEHSLTQQELSEIGNHGLALLEMASDLAGSLNLQYQRNQLNAIMVAAALWVARHGGKLKTLETVVDTLAEFGNSTSDLRALTALCDVMGEIINAASNELRFDFDNRHPGRPWRVINLNRGIIATRTHNPQIMESVFEELIRNIPDDAKSFFEKGVQQMDELDYPNAVREVMVRYQRQHRSFVLH